MWPNRTTRASARRRRADAAQDLDRASALAAELGAEPLAAAVRELAERAGLTPAEAAPARLARRTAGPGAPDGPFVDPLTPRERAVLERVAGGLT